MVEEHIYKLRKILKELDSIKGRHTELVSVYVPAGFNLQEIVNMLRQEYTLTENVKNKTVRNNVLGAIDKILQELRFFNKTPENGLALFAGNVSENEGETDIKVWTIQPPDPLKIKKYWCGQRFEVEPLQEMVAEKELYGLLVLDSKEATVGLLKGKKLEVLRRLDSIVPGKTIKGGQCLNPATLVPMADGNIMNMGSLTNNSMIKSADFNTFSILDSPILDVYNTNKSIVYRIVTQYPMMEIESSKDHFFFVFEDEDVVEKPAECLKEGDILLMPERINVKGEQQRLGTDYFSYFKITPEGREFLIRSRKEKGMSQERIADKLDTFQGTISGIEIGRRTFSKAGLEFLIKVCDTIGINFESFRKYIIPVEDAKLPNTLTKELAQILGYFVGDGNYDKNRVVFSESSKRTAKLYRDMLEKMFGIPVRFRLRKNKGYYEVRVCSKTVEKFFRGEFLNSKSSLTSLIPSKVLKSSNDVLSAFLKGLFDADGYVTDGVSLGINNKSLAQQVQLCLLRFGILSSLFRYDNKRNPYSKKYRYTIDIAEKDSLKTFLEKIGVSFKEKKINDMIKVKSDLSRIRRVLPVGGKIKNLMKKHSLVNRDFPSVSNFFYNKRFMSKLIFRKSVLNRIRNEELYSEMKWLDDCQLLPIVVKKIEKYEKSTPMVDIAVKHQSFIANGILVHNSAARYQRVREGLINDWYKIIAENVKELFSKYVLKGIIIGGPGPSKNDFFDQDYLENKMKSQILGVKSVGYTDEQGLEELVERSQDVLAEAAVAKEKALLQKFFEELKKGSGIVAYGKENVLKALEMGAVEIILLSDVLEADFDFFDEKAKGYGTTVEIISRDTREGEQLFQIGGIAGILRWKIF